MESNTEIIENIEDIKKEIIELNNMIDKMCLNIYNQNNESENKINLYKDNLEIIILEYHKICKIMYGKK
jgi:hypothetical protein